MKNFFGKNGVLILIIALLLTILIAVGTVFMQGSTDPLSNAMGVITSPLRNGIAAVTNWSENVYDFWFEYDQMGIDVAELEQEVAELEQEVRDGAEAIRENEQLRELLELQAQRRDFVFESAKVTARSFTGWDSTISLSKGSGAGVALGDCVVTESGHLVGVVSEVGENWCTVSTLISTNIDMGGLVARTYSAGILEGDFMLMNEGKLKLSYLPDEAQLVAGDQVLTSGMGDVYPPGLTVGQIDAVFTDASGMTRYAIITPDVDLDNLIQVFIVKDFDIVE